MKKARADDLLIAQGWADTKEKAQRLIMTGKVYTSKEEKVFTAGEKLPQTTLVYVKGADQPYVSRGGLKLEKAIEAFNLDLNGKTVLDIGASTGGFTDVALRNGARLVYALDVGTNQLAWKLRTDERVVVMEQTNFRTAVPEDFKDGRPEFATIDVSFISLEKIFPALKPILAEKGEVVALIKPQFEARREMVGEGGIISDPEVHRYVLEKIVAFLHDSGFSVERIIQSPIKGGKGNKEFLAYIQKRPSVSQEEEKELSDLISDALFS